MQYEEIRPILIDVLSFSEIYGNYISGRQISLLIKEKYPIVWGQLNEINTTVRSSYGTKYVLASYNIEKFIDNALTYYSKNNGIPYLETKEVKEISNSKVNVIRLWRLHPL